MKYQLFIYGRCSTCQKALRFLKGSGIEFDLLDITHTPPTREQLKLMVGYLQGDIKKFLTRVVSFIGIYNFNISYLKCRTRKL